MNKYDTNPHRYDDIIHLKYPYKTSRKKMSLNMRGAQFAPFAALTGVDDQVEETSRLTNNRIELEDEFKIIISEKIKYLVENKDKNNEVIITYFVPDKLKEGGEYIDKKGKIRKINIIENIIILEDNTGIMINEIIDITGDVFNLMY